MVASCRMGRTFGRVGQDGIAGVDWNAGSWRARIGGIVQGIWLDDSGCTVYHGTGGGKPGSIIWGQPQRNKCRAPKAIGQLDGYHHHSELYPSMEAGVVLCIASRGWGCWEATSIQVDRQAADWGPSSASHYTGIPGVAAGPTHWGRRIQWRDWIHGPDPARDIAVVHCIVEPPIARQRISECHYQWVGSNGHSWWWRVDRCRGLHAQIFRHYQIGPVDGGTGRIWAAAGSHQAIAGAWIECRWCQ